jgi:hydrogenase-4 membrane subunit HyfE
MSAPSLLADAPFAAALALFAIAAGISVGTRNLVKQTIGLVVALLAAALAAALLLGPGAPAAAFAAPLGFGMVALALTVRLREAHGSAEQDVIDAADDAADVAAQDSAAGETSPL